VSRPAELARNLAAISDRIAAACGAAGRDPAEITLIAVTKTYPTLDVLALAGLGLADFGENRDQEAAPKAAAVSAAGQPVTWHFIGQLQTNKAHSVARYADFRALGGPDPAGAGARRGGPRRRPRPDLPGPGQPGHGAALTRADADGRTLTAERARQARRRRAARHAPRGGGGDRGGGRADARGLMAVAPLGTDPRTAFAPLAPAVGRPPLSQTLRPHSSQQA